MDYETLWHKLTPLYETSEAKAIIRWVLDVRFGLSMADILCGKITTLSSNDQKDLETILQRLEKGDTLFIYTDGVPEATNADDELFGLDRMLGSLNSHREEAPSALLPHVKKDVDVFVGSAPQFDDLTMLAITYNGV